MKYPFYYRGRLFTQRFPALAYRDYRIFWIGQFASLIGTWMQSTVQPYLAYRITDQPFYLGVIGFSTAIPSLLLTLPAGVFIERVNKRKLVLVMQAVMMVQAFFLAFVTLSGIVTIWHMVISAFVLGSANAVEITARQAMFGELVGRDALPNAIALNSMAFNTARVIGPTLAAPFLLALQDAGEGWAFLANGVSYLFVMLSLAMIRNQPVPGGRKALRWSDFMEGQKFIRQTPIVLYLILMITIPAFFGFPFVQQIPVFARDVLAIAGESASAAAARQSTLLTSQGIGALVAAVTLTLYSTLRRKALFLTFGQFAFAIAMIIFSRVDRISLALPMIALIGWGTVTQLTLTNTLIQTHTPDHLRGRVIATYMWAQQGVAPFGSLFIGWLAQQYGAPLAVTFGASVCLVGYSLFHWRRPEIRQTIS